MPRLSPLLVLASACRTEPRCPADMVLLPAGRFPLGAEAPRQPHEGSARAVALPALCMDRHEFPNAVGQLARVQVTWDEARAACLALGKRLCTADEWERACRGSAGLRHPYGAERDPAACNTPWVEFRGPPIPYAPAGSHPRCRSEEGVMDLDGDVSEWVEDVWEGPRADFDQRAFPPETVYRTVRGGTMWSATFYGQDCLSAHGHPPGVRHVDDGFRCCAAPR